MQKESECPTTNNNNENKDINQNLGPYESFLKNYAEKNQQNNDRETIYIIPCDTKSSIQQAIGRIWRICPDNDLSKNKKIITP